MQPSRQRTFAEAVESSAHVVAVLFFVKAAELFFHLDLTGLGIIPRTPRGLLGILFSPLLHVNLAHLFANATPLFILLILLFWDRHYYPERTLAIIWIGSGFGTWLIGRSDSVHLGASSVIFGLVTYLIFSGFLMRSWRSALIALLVFALFGGIFYGVLPQPGPISWEGHLSGAITGIWVALRSHD